MFLMLNFYVGMSADPKIPESITPPDLDYSTESSGSKLARKTKDNPMMTIGKEYSLIKITFFFFPY